MIFFIILIKLFYSNDLLPSNNHLKVHKKSNIKGNSIRFESKSSFSSAKNQKENSARDYKRLDDSLNERLCRKIF